MRHLLALLFLLASPLSGQNIVCLGDSITEGADLQGGRQAWPALLEERLEPGARVINLGVSGATLLSATDRPYLEMKRWREAPELEARAAIVILGTNDSCENEQRRPWSEVGHLEADLDTLFTSVRERFGAERILLCSPPAMFPEKPGLSPERAADLAERAPRLAELASTYRAVAGREAGVEFVDLSRVLSPSNVTDGVHLTPFGSAAIADHLAAVLRTPLDPNPPDLAALLAKRGIEATASDYHGFPRLDFLLPEDGAGCVLVRPDRVTAGRPWIWRARFFGHEPAIDLALLDRGFHLFYCDVANLYGAPAAVARWERAYALLHEELGLAATPILHGLSRGGLPVLDYALAHPEQVAALVLDNAVCDFRSWPGGRNGKRSDEDWQRLLAVYGLSDEEAFAYERGPLTRLAPLAEAGVPVHVLIGTADDVVPPDENGELLALRYAELGGSVTVWRKPGQGHHPHGLHPPAPLVRALLRETGVDAFNPAAFPLPSVEYRGSPAGWGEGGSWEQQVRAMRELARAHPELEGVFFGDSITQGLTGAGDRLTHAGGARPVDCFPGAVSLGLSGDRTEHLLYRIDHGALALLEPKWIVVQIGVNNVNAGHTGPEVADGLEAVIALLLEREPQATLLIAGPFPTGHDPADPRRAAIETVHRRARALGERERVSYLDLRPLFLDEEGRPNELMRGDAVHINAAGQAAWMEAIEPLVRQGEAPSPWARWKHGPSTDPAFFPIAVWLQQPKNAPRYQAAGFNLQMGLWKGPTEEQLEALREVDMKVICEQNEVGLAHRDDPIIVGWTHGDEPDNAQPRAGESGYGPPIPPATIRAEYERMKQADPTRPIFLGLGQGVAWDGWIGRGTRTNHPEDYPEYVKGCDVASFDIYPGCHRNDEVRGKFWYVARGMERLAEWTQGEKILWSTIECTRISNLEHRATPHEVRAEVWMSIIRGATGIVYFVHQFEPTFIEAALFADEEMLVAVTKINREIHELAPVLNSPSRPELAGVKSAKQEVPVALLVKQHEGDVYLFAVCLRDEPTTATFEVEGLRGRTEVEVLHEERRLESKNGKFEDRFTPWQVHLYRVKGK